MDEFESYQIISESWSPDQRWKAVLFERDAGATTRTSTNVSVLKSSGNLPDGTGNVFVLDASSREHGKPAVLVEWTSAPELIIRYNPSYQVIHKDETAMKPNTISIQPF